MSKLALLNGFKDALLRFMDALIDLLPDEKDIFTLRVLFESTIPIESAMKTFTSRILPYKEMVETRDERFFIECTDIFSGIRKDKVSYFKDLWQSNTLTAEDKDSLWKWFAIFLKFALKFQQMESQ